MVGVLAKAGWLEVSQAPGTGNRRQLKLTRSGSQLVTACAELLEDRFSELVAKAGIGYEAYLKSTRRLLVLLDEDQQRPRLAEGAS